MKTKFQTTDSGNGAELYRQVLNDIKAGKIKNFYLFSGEEKYLQQELIRRLLQSLGLQGDKSACIDYHEIDCEYKTGNLDLRALISELKMPPFMLRKRIVFVKNSNLWHSALSQSNQEFFKNLSALIADEQLTAVCIFQEEKVDKRLKHYSALQKNSSCALYHFNFLPENVLIKWAGTKFAKAGIKVKINLLQQLVAEPYNNMQLLDNEIAKLCLYCRARELEIPDADTVLELVKRDLSNTVFDLMDAVGNKRLHSALAILKNLQDNKEPFPRLLLMLGRHCRELLLSKLYVTDKRITLNFPVWKLKKLQAQAHKFQVSELETLIVFFAEADMALKSGLADEMTLADLLLAKLQRCDLEIKFA